MKLWLRSALAVCVSVSLLTGTMQASFVSSLSSYWSSLSSNQRKLVVGAGVGIAGTLIWKKYNTKKSTDTATAQAPVLSVVGHSQNNPAEQNAQDGNKEKFRALPVGSYRASVMVQALLEEPSSSPTFASSKSISTPKREESERKQEVDRVTPGEAPLFGERINFPVPDQGKENNNCAFHMVRNSIWFVESVLGKKSSKIKDRVDHIEQDRKYAHYNWGRPDNLDDGQLWFFAQGLNKDGTPRTSKNVPKMKPATFTIINSPDQKNIEQFTNEGLERLCNIGRDLATTPGMHHIFFLNTAHVNERTGHADGGHWVASIVHNDNDVIKLHWGDSHLIEGDVDITLGQRKNMFKGLEWFLSQEFRDQVDQLKFIKEGLDKSYNIMNGRVDRDLDFIRGLRKEYPNSVNRSSDVRAFLVSVSDRISKDVYLKEHERKDHQGLCSSFIEPMEKEGKSNKAGVSIDKDLKNIASAIEEYYEKAHGQLFRMLEHFEQIPQLLQIGAAKMLVPNNEITITNLLGRLELLIEQDSTIPQLIKDRLEAVKKEFASVTATEQILQQVQRVRAKSK